MTTAAALRRYVLAHPQACDTVAGISTWWLALPLADRSHDTVAAAVEQLVACGEMEFLSGPDGQTVYRAAQPAVRDGTP